MNLRIASMIGAILVLSAASLQATTLDPLTIDTFDVGDQELYVSRTKHFDSDEASSLDPTRMIGGYRDVWLEWTSGASSTADVITTGDGEIGSGFFFSKGVGKTKATIVWDGHQNLSGDPAKNIDFGLGADLTQGGANRFQLDIGDITVDSMTLTITVYKDSTHSWTWSRTLDDAASGIIEANYEDDFTAVGLSGPVDFSSVGAIVMELNGVGYGSDIWIRSIKTVPEPSTLAMGVIGMVGFIAMGRRWKEA